ncbi:MAG: hypothetical protein AB7E32_14045 [Desulfovibrio sp.]
MSDCIYKRDLRDGMWLCENPEFDKALTRADEFRTENVRLRKALSACARNDKTHYEHHEPRPDGTRPCEGEGTIWLTPREIANAALKEKK